VDLEGLDRTRVVSDHGQDNRASTPPQLPEPVGVGDVDGTRQIERGSVELAAPLFDRRTEDQEPRIVLSLASRLR
jgi:hypothetical protein